MSVDSVSPSEFIGTVRLYWEKSKLVVVAFAVLAVSILPVVVAYECIRYSLAVGKKKR